jgi:hypothetical protein
MYYDTALSQLRYWNGTAWVSSSGAVDLRYNGSWAAGSYTDGDIVIGSDGIAYMAVKPTSAAPTPWTGVYGPVGPAGVQGPTGPAGPTGIGVPTPVVNGQWIKGVGGAAVWSPITVADVSGIGARVASVPSGTNVDISWAGGNVHTLIDDMNPGSAVTLRSYGVPTAGAGTHLIIRNGSSSSITILHNVTTGGGSPFYIVGPGSGNLTLATGETIEFVYDVGYWVEVNRSVRPSYSTALPANPVDGQEALIADSITNPSRVWQFRYNARSTSAYKWEFIGGSPYITGVSAPAAGFLCDSAWRDFPQTYTALFAGEYIFQAGFFCYIPGAGGVTFIGAGINGTNAGNFGGMSSYAANIQMSAQAPPSPLSVTAAGQVVSMMYWANGGGTGTFEGGSWSLIPRRIG